MFYSYKKLRHSRRINKISESILVILGFCLVLAVSTHLKIDNYYKNSNIENLDASYHVLATVRSLQENPVSETKLMPSITMGSENDKYVPWGATIQNNDGLYIYTSFPPLGFIIPYVFFSAFNLEVNLYNLLLLNSFFSALSALLVFILVLLILNKSKKLSLTDKLFALLTSGMYLSSLEVLYSQGLVYWGQSVMQIIIFLMAILIILLHIYGKRTKPVFISLGLLAFIAPLIEWTGILLNFAILIYCLSQHKFRQDRYYLWLSLFIAVVSIGSVLVFALSFLGSVGIGDLFTSLSTRFDARRAGTKELALPWSALIKGYFASYGPAIIVSLFAVVISIKRSEFRSKLLTIIKKIAPLFLIAIMIMVENVIMQQHATAYSFDRLKIYLLIALVLSATYVSFSNVFRIAMCVLISGAIVINLWIFTLNPRTYEKITEADISNKVLLNNIITEDKIIGVDGTVRGYVNLSLNRNAYEYINNADQLVEISRGRSVSKALLLSGDTYGQYNYLYNWQFIAEYDFDKLTIYIRDRNIDCKPKRIKIDKRFIPSDWSIINVSYPNDTKYVANSVTYITPVVKPKQLNGVCFGEANIDATIIK